MVVLPGDIFLDLSTIPVACVLVTPFAKGSTHRRSFMKTEMVTTTTSVLLLALLLPRVSSFVGSPLVVVPPPLTGHRRGPFALGARQTRADNSNVSDDEKNSSAKRAALEGVLNQIERAYGRGSVMRLGQAKQMQVATIGTGSLTLDAATGGGYPRGRVVEIYGPESSGKTTLALHAIAEVQKEGGTAAFIDAEHALDPSYAAGCGVDVDGLLVTQPDSGEMALDVVDQLVRSAAVDVIVIDSVAALVPRAELEGDMSDQNIGLQARLMSKALRKITGSLALSQCTVIFLNQLRSKVGVIYGSPEVTSGGNALKFYASIRLDTRRKEILPDNSGIRVKVKVVKNKVAAPFQTVILDVLFGTGVDFVGGMLDAAVDLDVVTRKGSWYAYRDENLAQGRQRCVELLRNDEELAASMEADVRRVLAEIQEGRLPESLRKSRPTASLPTVEVSVPETMAEDSYLE